MRHPSRRTLARAAACGGVIALAAGFAPAAAASPAGQTSVPCEAAALASALSGAASGGTLILAAGCTYHMTGPLPAISANLTIDGRGATVVGQEEDPGFDILSVPSGVSVHIRDLNFTGGGDPYVCGGAINTSGDVTIEGGTFRLDGAASPSGGESPTGGAICNGGQLTVIATRFTGNRVLYESGGAIDNHGQLTLRYDSLSGNKAVGNGGAIENLAALTVVATAITGNTAGAGGAGGIDNEGGTVDVRRDLIQSNLPVNCSDVPGCTN